MWPMTEDTQIAWVTKHRLSSISSDNVYIDPFKIVLYYLGSDYFPEEYLRYATFC